MQLNPPSSIRVRLSAAACVLLATGGPGAAVADPGATTQLDFSMLFYGEQARAKVVEPTARGTRISPNGQIISGQISLDVITGASPSGALPSGVVTAPAPGGGEDVHTVTAASGGGGGGGGGEPDPGAIPTVPFNDARIALDGNWQRPFGPVTPALGGHVSRERDYQSLGLNGKVSLELLRKLTTVTAGAGYNQDYVFPTGGTRLALSDSVIIVGTDWNPKDVNSAMVGISQILTRRWMVALNGTRSVERGYLTDPYKV
ncbi:MAG: DUF3570 domain-containing protein, partial [Candidatus Eiseniibacteriota bacterium]